MSSFDPRQALAARWRDPRGLAARAAVVVAFNALFLAFLALRPGGDDAADLRRAIGDLAQCAGPLLGLALCHWRLPRGARRGPIVALSLGVAAFALGQIIWTYYELVLRRPLPLPAWSDVAFLAVYPAMLLGIYLLPGGAISPAHRARVALDSLLVMAAGVTFSWYFILGPTLLGGTGTALQKAVGLAYPLGDLVTLGCLLLLADHAADLGGAAVRLLGLGFAAIVATDSLFLRGLLDGSYATGSPIDVGWPIGYMVAALGIRALAFPRPAAARPAALAGGPAPPPLWRTLLPFALAPAVAALLVVVSRPGGDPALEGGVRLGAAALVALLLARQGVALVENQRLYRQLQATYRHLADHSDQLAAQATIDPLTELPNHRALHAAIEHELERARRYHQPFAILFLDLDHFKALNDAHGHAAGDDALRAFGRVARGCLRAVDTIGRWGGEEFVAVLPQADAAEALAIAERVRAAVAAHPFGPAGLRLTCSLGLALCPDHGDARDTLVAAADGTMYAAKRLGRNQVRLAGSPEVLALLDGPTGREETALIGMVEALAGLVEERDAYTGRHTDDVGALAGALARALGRTADEARLIALAGRLHDIGKVALPDAVLQKPGRLTDDEWALIRRHPVIGAEVLERVPALRALVPLVRGHHERWDGGGYPDGLAGAAIPLGARIVAVADAYAAMTTDRPYQAARSAPEALAELRRHASRQFDPAVVAALARVLVPEGALV